MLLCFLLRWPGRFLTLFARFVCFFLSPFALNALLQHSVFLLYCECCFCRLFGPVAGVAFFSLCPPVIMHAKQCLPCALPCPALPTFFFLPFKNTHTHPINPHAPTETLFTHTHMVMSVLVFVYVFVCSLIVLCVSACLCLGLLVCMYSYFVFVYVSVVALCAYECVCMCISCLGARVSAYVFCRKYVYFDTVSVIYIH